MLSAIRRLFLLYGRLFRCFSLARIIIFAFGCICVTIVAPVVDVAAEIPNGKNGYSHCINTVFALFSLLFFRFVIVSVTVASRHHRRNNVAFKAMQLTNKRKMCQCLVQFLYINICICCCLPVLAVHFSSPIYDFFPICMVCSIYPTTAIQICFCLRTTYMLYNTLYSIYCIEQNQHVRLYKCKFVIICNMRMMLSMDANLLMAEIHPLYKCLRLQSISNSQSIFNEKQSSLYILVYSR